MNSKRYFSSFIKIQAIGLGIFLSFTFLTGNRAFSNVPLQLTSPPSQRPAMGSGANPEPLPMPVLAPAPVPAKPDPLEIPGSNSEPFAPDDNSSRGNRGGDFLGTLLEQAIRNSQSASQEGTSQAEVQPVSTSSSIAVIEIRLKHLGLVQVDCRPDTVFVQGLAEKTVCAEPTAAFPSGEYVYNLETREIALQPVSLLGQMGLTQIDCRPNTIFIINIAETTVCAEPTASNPAGVYRYNSEARKLILENE